jgi:FKBP12-rapamycin complex-associated protein
MLVRQSIAAAKLTTAPAALPGLLLDLRNARDDGSRARVAKGLRMHVEAEARDIFGERFTRYMDGVSQAILGLINSVNTSEKLAGIAAIDELLDLESEENANKIARFADLLRLCLPHTDGDVMEKAAKALGHLARAGGALTVDFVEFEAVRALEWLREPVRFEPRRHASVLVIRELAHNAPILFYAKVESCLKYIWAGLWDQNMEIRRIAAGALRACLQLSARRGHLRSEWYSELFEQAKQGCKTNKMDDIHGSLLAVAELLKNAEDFMSARLDDSCDLVLHYKEHRNSLVRRTVIELLPMLAGLHSASDSKADKQLSKSADHLIRVLRQGTDRSVAFVALGQLALVTPRHVKPHLKAITQQIRDSTNPRSSRKAFCVEAVTCAGMLTRAHGEEVSAHIADFFDFLFNGGLSRPLISSLVEIIDVLPTFTDRVHTTLLNAISMTLVGQPFGIDMDDTRSMDFSVPTGSDPSTNIILALNTLSTFNFGPQAFMHFMQNSVLELMEDESAELRREAVTACARMLERTIASISPPDDNTRRPRSHYSRQVADAIGQMLQVGISDESPHIRRAVLESLQPAFDPFLAQPENIRSLYLAINDEDTRIRELAVVLMGRLTCRNPAYVLPCLRTTLIQLLAEIDAGDDGRLEGESARLLGLLIRSSPRLAEPYVAPVLEALTRRLDNSVGCSSIVAANVLGAIGELATVGPALIRERAGQLFRLTIDGLQDQSSMSKRQVALRTLGKLVESTGWVIRPYFDHPHLLSTLLDALRGEPSWEVRHEVIKVIGIIGAVDPYRHAAATSSVDGAPVDSKDESTRVRSGKPPQSGLSPSSPDFYPTVAIDGLMKILRDSSLSHHSNMVVQAVILIFKHLGLKCVPFLREIVPPMLKVMRACEPGLRDFLFQKLGELVTIVKQHIRPYMDDIFELILAYWSDAIIRDEILGLVETIALALGDEFKPYLTKLMPHMLDVLRGDRSEQRQGSLQVLHALEVFGANLDEHLHLVIPELVQLFNLSDADSMFRKRALQTMGYLCRVASISDFTSRIVHPVVRVLDSSTVESFIIDEAMATLCCLVYNVRDTFTIFVQMLKKVMLRRQIHDSDYETMVECLLKREPYPPDAKFGSQYGGLPGYRGSDASIGLGGPDKLSPNQENLRLAWETSTQRSIQDDWAEWMRRFSVEMLRESSSPALRACAALANVYPPLARELFNAAFVSCYTELEATYKHELVTALEQAFGSPSITPDILQVLLNLAEFMEREEIILPINIHTLGALAKQCHAYAKALHYKELEFQTSPETAIEELIDINNKLGQHEAAAGILKHAQVEYGVELKESWYEKLNNYEKALQAYDKRRVESLPTVNVEATLGTMRCLNALGDYEKVSQLALEIWGRGGASLKVGEMEKRESESVRRAIAPVAAYAAWGLGRWREMEEYVVCMRTSSVETNFFGAVLNIWKGSYGQANVYIEKCRDLLDKQLTALVGESYKRAYKMIVSVQELAELEEIIEYKRCGNPVRQQVIRQMWKTRLFEAKRHVMDWMRLLNIRRMVIPFREDPETYVKFVSLCVKSNEMALAAKTLASLLECPTSITSNEDVNHRTAVKPPIVAFAYLRFRWVQGDESVVGQLQQLASRVTSADVQRCQPRLKAKIYHELGSWQQKMAFQNGVDEEQFAVVLDSYRRASEIDASWYKAWRSWALMHYEIVAHYERKTGSRRPNIVPKSKPPVHRNPEPEPESQSQHEPELETDAAPQQESAPAPKQQQDLTLEPAPELESEAMTEPAPAKERSHVAVADANSPEQPHSVVRPASTLPGTPDLELKSEPQPAVPVDSQPPKSELETPKSARAREHSLHAHVHAHVVPAIKGFFESIALSSTNSNRLTLQDILRLLTLWFKYGAYREVDSVVTEGFDKVSVDNWLQVIPQLIARIHTPSVTERMHDLLCRIAINHPQALIFPLAVTTTMSETVRKESAQRIMDKIREKQQGLVENALLVANELIRVAVLWQELWHEGLDEASRLYFAEKDEDGMLQTLAGLHKMMEKGPETARERSFLNSFGRELEEALKWCHSYRRTGRESDLSQAWDLYSHVFRKINRQLPLITLLELESVSPKLLRACGMGLAVPGTYRAGIEPVTIESFGPTLNVITSKQRPRKLTIKGSDGRDYVFLLKGHEDIRQDERVMQLLGLINGLLERDHDTSNRDISIRRYDVVPLSPTSGLIGWVPHHDTLHTLIRDYRETHKVILNIEHRLMLQMAPNYDQLTLLQKVEVFMDCMSKTNGEDLKRVLWLKSRNAESWLDRRTNCTRSLATMSMVGYILGLGDRHPSNLLLDRVSGKILHIDFGDCFEVAIHREKFPERVPFRLTRMLRKAMEASGIESNFRVTCESVMRVLRQNRNSVMAMLEAFVHDPLVNWGLTALHDPKAPRRRRTRATVDYTGLGSGAVDSTPFSGNAIASLLTSELDPSSAVMSHARRRSVVGAAAAAGDARLPQAAQQALNERAVAVILRVSSKLKGQDFGHGQELDVQKQVALMRSVCATGATTHSDWNLPLWLAPAQNLSNPPLLSVQVQRLIDQATSVENLCQCYIGWCPFW